jgi:hypothetical protein
MNVSSIAAHVSINLYPVYRGGDSALRPEAVEKQVNEYMARYNSQLHSAAAAPDARTNPPRPSFLNLTM